MVVTVLVAAGWVFQPDLEEIDLGLAPGPADSRFSACVQRVDRLFESELSVLGAFIAPAQLTRASATAGESVEVTVDETGARALDLSDVGTTGVDGIFLEFGAEDFTAGVVSRGSGGVMAAGCTPPSRTRLGATGLSTRNAESLDLVLVNPYAVDAVVTVESSSEVGPDSASELEQVLVPARSTVVRDLAAILPLRQQLSVSILVTDGAAHAFFIQSGDGDTKAVEAVAPASSWYLPVPSIDGLRLTIANPSAEPVDVRLDGFVGGTFVESVLTETIEPRSHLVLDPAAFNFELGAQVGLAVFAASEVSVGFWADGEGVRTGSPAPVTLAGGWLVPARLGGPSTIWLLNPDEIELEVVVRPLVSGIVGRTVTLAPSAVTAIPVDGRGAGYSLTAPGDIAVVWTTVTETGTASGRAFPISLIGEED